MAVGVAGEPVVGAAARAARARADRGAALALLCLAACGGPPYVEPVARPIIAGAADPGDPAVAELIAFVPPNKAAVCTATVISPHLLLTAGHCIQVDTTTRYMVFFGADFHQSTVRDLAPVLATAADPAFDRSSPAHGHDLGVVAFADALPVAPVPTDQHTLGPELVGQPVRYIGYGLTDGVAQTGVGVRREATEPVAQLSDVLIRLAPGPNGTCEGDSGAPLLMSTPAGEVLIGVASYGDDPQCQKSSYFMRFDTQRAWVDEQVRKYDPASAADAGPPPAATNDSGGCTTSGRPGPAPALWWVVVAGARGMSARRRRPGPG